MINNVLTLESLNLYVLNVLENHNVIALLRQAITELFKRNSYGLFLFALVVLRCVFALNSLLFLVVILERYIENPATQIHI